jgi:peptide chain release factor 1
VAEGGGGRRVGQVVRRHVHRLDRGDRAGLGRGDALLQAAHFLGERRLVADRRGHAAEQRRHLGACQRETVDVVDEKQDVLALVAEALGHREAGERTRRRLPGGSFIWPNTIATFESSSLSSFTTSASIIS